MSTTDEPATGVRASPSRAGREPWADVAKGVCIVLVVLWHVVHKDLVSHDWGVGPAARAWELLTLWLVPLRMPLFFVVSGVFAASAMARPWPTVLRDRSLKLYWLFALWVLIQVPFFLLVPSAFPTGRATSPGDLLTALTIEPPNVWYLYALAWYVVVAKLVSRVPTAVVLPLALALSSVAATGVLPPTGNASGVLQYFFFFLVGLRAKALVVAIARAASARHLAASAALFAASATFVLFTPGMWVDTLEPLAGLSAVHTGITAAVLVARVPGAGPTLAALGQRTLPVYVLHLPVVALLFVVGEHVDLAPVAFVYPVVATALVCAVALLLERSLRAAGLGGWLFDLPRPVHRTLTRSSGPANRVHGQPARRPRAR